ncbi:membrane-anchored junction protein [Plectropomus leopardus]|uniref:membrane-anchored junction protein n=1 Tax=Plectropomus leopardus TaxID=160734 RepID=UPI001C4D164E|nr:membrane-anchored junction protein [Plectropomus leopardus]
MLQAFSLTFPQTRYFKAESLIYKFKFRGGSSFRGEGVMEENCLNQEMEEIIRTVLGNLDNLQPFSSAHFNVYPYKKRSKAMRKHGGRRLKAYPFNLILYLEKNVQTEKQADKLSPEKEVAQQFPSVSEPPKKCRRTDSPLEEAILKDLLKDMEAERKVSVVGGLQEDPGHADEDGSKVFDKPEQESGVNTLTESGTSGEVHSGIIQDMGEEEEGDEEEDADSVPGTPVRPGILTRLASHVFPFSLFLRDA